MPTYEYQCPEGHVFDKFQKMTDKPRAKCPVCGKTATRKISGGAGLVFKGSGFYITDYGKDGKGPRKAEGEKPAAEAKSETTAKSDKPEAKPAAKTESGPAKSAPSKREGKAASE
jgi:putative FmdB family regulatory protein